MAGIEIKKNNLEAFICSSNDAINFKIIRNVADIDDDELNFQPEFSHQHFENETIFGYKGLEIKLYYTAAQLEIYLNMDYQHKVKTQTEEIKADDVLPPISQQLPEEYHTNLDSFIKCLDQEKSFKPIGELLETFTITEGKKTRQFEVYISNYKTPGFLKYHERMQSFILWFIDAASYIDSDDEKWDFFTLFEKEKVKDEERYAFIGYSTVYKYYAYPIKIRPRISQMLILPPYQKVGLGPKLLQAMYNSYIKETSVLDITVEDPSDNFTRMRDLIDCKNCLPLQSFQTKFVMKGFASSMALEAQSKLKLNKKQSRRCYEILRLLFTNQKNNEEYKEYRLDVKKRLNLPYKRQNLDAKRLEKIMNPVELALHATVQKNQVESLQQQYDDLEMEYQVIVERLNS